MHFCICQHPTHIPPFLLLLLFPGTHPGLKNIFGLGGCSRWERVQRGHAAPGHAGIPQTGCQKQGQPSERSTRASGSCRKQGSLHSQSAEPAWEKQGSWESLIRNISEILVILCSWPLSQGKVASLMIAAMKLGGEPTQLAERFFLLLPCDPG